VRIDRHYFNLLNTISNETELGNDTEKLSYILNLYQKNRSIGKTLHKICNSTNISNEEKQYFFAMQDWEKEAEDICKCPYLLQNTQECIERAYKNMALFVKETKAENNSYMNNSNNLTKLGRTVLRQIAFNFSKSTAAICSEIENICFQIDLDKNKIGDTQHGKIQAIKSNNPQW